MLLPTYYTYHKAVAFSAKRYRDPCCHPVAYLGQVEAKTSRARESDATKYQ